MIADDKICEARRSESAITQMTQHQIKGLASTRSMILFGIRLAKCKDELRKNGRVDTIRATGAALIASTLLYFCESD